MNSVFSLTMQVGTPRTWMGVAHIACSAMALNIHISTFYPYVNGLENVTANLLNTIFNCTALGNEVSIIIQWSSGTFYTNKHWEPNHFVALVSKIKRDCNFKISDRGIIIVDDEDSDGFSKDLNGKKQYRVNDEPTLSENLFKTINSKKQNSVSKAQPSYSSDNSETDDFVNNVKKNWL